LPYGVRFRHNAGIDEALPTFTFRSGIWLNLHHCLYGQARRFMPQAQQERHPEELLAKALPKPYGDRWTQAVTYYVENLAVHDLLRHPEMRVLKWYLAELPDTQEPDPEVLPEELVTQLIAAMPVYKEAWWEHQRQVNVAYIEAAEDLAAHYGPPLAKRMAASFQARWSTEALPVDVVYWARWSGAYTTLNPDHIVISSSTPGNRGPAALEVLFHEASHTLFGPRWGTVSKTLERICVQHQREEPRDLWHAIMFYTDGVLVQEVLKKGDDEAYVPYADKQGLYQRVPGWLTFRQAFTTHWLPYLKGDAGFDEALEQVVLAVTVPER
jgi:hypothetical protein